MTLGDNAETGTRAVLMKLQHGTAAVENSLVGPQNVDHGPEVGTYPCIFNYISKPCLKTKCCPWSYYMKNQFISNYIDTRKVKNMSDEVMMRITLFIIVPK